MVYYILPSIPIILKNIMKKYSSVVHVSGHEISTTNHLNKTGNTYVTKVKFGRLIPFMKFYHTKKNIWKNIRLSSTYIVTKFPHLIVNKTRNIHCITLKFGTVLPLHNIYHIPKKVEKIFTCRPRIWSRNFHT